MNRIAETSIIGAMLTDSLAHMTASACLKSTDFELGYAQLFQALKDLPKDQKNDLIEVIKSQDFEPGNVLAYIKILRNELPTIN